MSLADELLADLEEMDDIGRESPDIEMPAVEEAEVKPEFFKPAVAKTLTLDDVCKLRNSPQLSSILEEIEKYSGQNRTSDDIQVCTMFYLVKFSKLIYMS